MANIPKRTDHLYGRAVELFGYLVMVSAVLVVAYQCLLWLQYGYWTSWSMREIFGNAEIDIRWRGLRKIVSWLLEWPLGLGLLVSGLIFRYMGAISAKASKEEYKLHLKRLEYLAANKSNESEKSSAAFRAGQAIGAKLRSPRNR